MVDKHPNTTNQSARSVHILSMIVVIAAAAVLTAALAVSANSGTAGGRKKSDVEHKLSLLLCIPVSIFNISTFYHSIRTCDARITRSRGPLLSLNTPQDKLRRSNLSKNKIKATRFTTTLHPCTGCKLRIL